jgi:hypothetical protein
MTGNDLHDEHSEQDATEGERVPEERRRTVDIRSLDDVLAFIVASARPGALLLKSHLTGTLVLQVSDPNQAYCVDWTTDTLEIRKGDLEGADCRIAISRADLIRVARGELNPQIGMLSGKIRASGNPEMAMYFFNLVVVS